MKYFHTFTEAIDKALRDLEQFGEDVDTGRWQGVSTEGHPDMVTRELLNWGMSVPIPKQENGTVNWADLQGQIKPNLPWADDHFEERVSRIPSNPGEAYKTWPWWRGQEEATSATIPSGAVTGEIYVDEVKDPFVFTHTYQERFWPKQAGSVLGGSIGHNVGIRYDYGDLDDVVAMLLRDPYTRQAWFPIFFPEDTGAVHGGRIPCTLGYQFMLRNNQLHMWYVIRSCDYVRHFRDDIYLACRLLLWVLEQLQERELRGDTPQVWVDVDPGSLNMLIFSLHYHKGDLHHVRRA